MTLPYDLQVQFEDVTRSTTAGVVRVTASGTCTCRKLNLRSGWRRDPDGEFHAVGRPQTLADWDEWHSGTTYTYPFSCSRDGDAVQAWGVSIEVHRIGELDADPATLWLVAEPAQKAEESLAPRETDRQREPVLEEPPLPSYLTNDLSLVRDVSLELDKPDAAYAFGEEISGAVRFKLAQKLDDLRIGIDYQWRRHGRTERASGNHHAVSVSLHTSWERGKSFRIPFRFAIPSGPRTAHGYSEKLDWYVWPVLIPLDGSTPLPLLEAETIIQLYPTEEEGADLRVESMDFGSNHLLLGGILYLVAIVVGGALLLHWLGIWNAGDFANLLDKGWVFWAGAVVAMLWHGSQLLHNWGLAERKLGVVEVYLDGVGEVAGTVWLEPRRDVQLYAINMTITADEEMTVRQGTASNTTKKELFRESETVHVDEKLIAGEEWSAELAVPLPSHLPPTGRRSGGVNTTIAIVWCAEIAIEQEDGDVWQKRYLLNVRDAADSQSDAVQG